MSALSNRWQRLAAWSNSFMMLVLFAGVNAAGAAEPEKSKAASALVVSAPSSSVKDGSVQGALLPRDSTDAAVFRGGLVFSNYCVTCHGINADGNGRAARLYNPKPANLRISDKNDAYYALIIRMGGEPLGRSSFMPPWGAELTDEQMKDLVAYLRSINERTVR